MKPVAPTPGNPATSVEPITPFAPVAGPVRQVTSSAPTDRKIYCIFTKLHYMN